MSDRAAPSHSDLYRDAAAPKRQVKVDPPPDLEA
jgi:hypothetical protein